MLQYHRITLAGANPLITSYPTQDTFERAISTAPAQDAKVPCFAIQSETDCEQLSIAQMVQCINYLGTGKAIKSLHDRKTGAARLWALLTTRRDPDAGTVENSTVPATSPESSPDPEKELDRDAASEYESAKPTDDVSGGTTNEDEDDMTKKAKAKKVAKKANGTKRDGGKTAAVAKLLQRANGCTRKEVLEATGWKAVSMQQMAKNLGLKLTQSKEKGEVTHYFGK